MLGSIWLYGGWAIRLLMIPVVARRHRTFVAIAWLAPIFLVPWIGALLYLWIGRLGLQRGADRHREVRRRIESDDRMRQQHAHASDDVPEAQRDLVRLTRALSTERMGGFPLLDDNHLELIQASGDYAQRLIADIDAAQNHVHLTYYFFAADATGRRVGDALVRASRRGVRCRVLVDAWMSRTMRGSLKPWLEGEGVEVSAMLPMQPMRRPLARVDVRNHRKIAVIDGRVGYTGSHNLHDPDHGLEHGVWHQISCRVRGPAVLQLQMLFVEDWYFATDRVLDGPEHFPDPEAAGEATVQCVPEGPSYGVNLLQRLFTQSLAEAERRVLLTTPYFVPDETLQMALELAAMRGVQVDLVLPRRSDERLADLAGRAYYQPLLDAGVRIHQHRAGLLHAKTITVDDAFALVGTANLDHRSLFLNYEAVLLIFGGDFTARLREAQQRLLADTEPLDPERWRARPEWRKVRDHTLKLLSPVL